jgi:hypothetical protein
MKKKLIAVLSIALIATSLGIAGSTDEHGGARVISMAESEFISQIHELDLVCNKYINNLELCLPELVILDDLNHPYAKGKYSSSVLLYLIEHSDFLTTIHGIDFYKLNTKAF